MAHELDIAEDTGFHRRQGRFERIGATVLVLVLVAAALGLFGPGLFNRTRVATHDGALGIEFPRFARMQAPVHLSLEVRPAPSSDRREARVWLSADYLERIDLERITPEPESSELGSDGTTLVFACDGGSGPLSIALDLRARVPGSTRGRIGTSATDAVELGHFVYP